MNTTREGSGAFDGRPSGILRPSAFTARESLQVKRLGVVMAIMAVFFGAQLAGAIWADSDVLRIEAVHVLTDVAGLGLAALAMRIAVRRPTARFTYGLRRVEPVAAIFNSLIVLMATALLVREAIVDLAKEEGGPLPDRMLVVAALGLVVNGISAWLIHGAIGHGGGLHLHAHDDHHDAHGSSARAHAHDHDAHGASHGAHDHGAHGASHGAHDHDAHGASHDAHDHDAHGASRDAHDHGAHGASRGAHGASHDAHGAPRAALHAADHPHRATGAHDAHAHHAAHGHDHGTPSAASERADEPCEDYDHRHIAHHGHGHVLNLRGAWLHLFGDALGSLAAIVAALAIRLGASPKVDPIASFVVAAILVYGGVRLLHDAVLILLEASPPHLPIERVRAVILATSGVAEVHDLHVWSLGAGHDAVSAHVRTQASDPEMAGRIEDALRSRFAVEYVTIQVETSGVPCQAESLES